MVILILYCVSVLNITRCPYCKTANYAVEYRGVRTKEEKGMEQIVIPLIIIFLFRLTFNFLCHCFSFVKFWGCSAKECSPSIQLHFL